MKRATPTPNRFITSTPNWWVNAFVLFAFFFLFDGCVDEASLAGFKKQPRLVVKFKEFDIPATTVQVDSVSSQISRSSVTDRWLGGVINGGVDPNFGSVTSSIFTQIIPSRINTTGKTDFVLNKVTLNLVLDYYVYGDTLNSTSTFELHEITDAGFRGDNEYFTKSNLSHDPSPIAQATYAFKYDSIKKYRTRNSDAVSTNDVYDTLSFDIPIDAIFFKTMFDTLRSKGIYTKQRINNKDSVAYNGVKTDSVFLKRFKGLAVKPVSGNRILGFRSRVGTDASSSRLTFYYSYNSSEGNKQVKTSLYFQSGLYFNQNITSFSKIDYDRNATNLSGLRPEDKYTNFKAPDDFCYVQAGTGLYTRLDFKEVKDTFNLFSNVAVNSAELIVPLETTQNRVHVKAPAALLLRIAKDNLRLFNPPFIPSLGSAGDAILIPDPLYGNSFYCTYNEGFLDAVGDGDDRRILTLELQADNGQQYYRGFLTQFLHYQTNLPQTVFPVTSLALVPAASFGKSLDGVSFKKDKIKLRVYYSIPN